MPRRQTGQRGDTIDPMSDTPKSLYMQRTGVRQYVARNQDGAEIRIVHGPGLFSPRRPAQARDRGLQRNELGRAPGCPPRR